MTEQDGQDRDEPVKAADGLNTEAAQTAENAVSASAELLQHANAAQSDASAALANQESAVFGEARDRMKAMADMAFGRDDKGFSNDFATRATTVNNELVAGYMAAAGGMTEFNRKVVDAWRTNAESAFEHWKRLSSVKTLSEAIALNAEHTRQQMETVMIQTRELSTLATQVARTGLGTLKSPTR